MWTYTHTGSFPFFPVNNALPRFQLYNIHLPLSPKCLSARIMEKTGCRRTAHELLITMP